ncbi:hypothetical protein [Streptomyces javensis]|uniref:Transposase n=1 Tax=Streptomyces javensis TaxID=114698 RepID=A0ABN1WHG0_9ACTN|nr:hypothetical protein [Streptomyces javensis]
MRLIADALMQTFNCQALPEPLADHVAAAVQAHGTPAQWTARPSPAESSSSAMGNLREHHHLPTPVQRPMTGLEGWSRRAANQARGEEGDEGEGREMRPRKKAPTKKAPAKKRPTS